MSNITWASSTTSTNPPQALSDAFSLSGFGSFTAQVNVVDRGPMDFYVGVYGSTDGINYALIGSEQNVIENATLNFGPITVGAYVDVKIHNRYVLGYSSGYFQTSTWTGIALPPTIGALGLPVGAEIPASLGALFVSLGNNFGIDVLCLTDLDPNFSLVQNALAQDVWHYISEQPGSIFWSANQTFSLRALLSKGILPSQISAVAATIQSVIAADERVAQAQCQITPSGSESLEIQITVFPEQGSAFNLVASINKVTITLISVGLVNL